MPALKNPSPTHHGEDVALVSLPSGAVCLHDGSQVDVAHGVSVDENEVILDDVLCYVGGRRSSHIDAFHCTGLKPVAWLQGLLSVSIARVNATKALINF